MSKYSSGSVFNNSQASIKRQRDQSNMLGKYYGINDKLYPEAAFNVGDAVWVRVSGGRTIATTIIKNDGKHYLCRDVVGVFFEDSLTRREV